MPSRESSSIKFLSIFHNFAFSILEPCCETIKASCSGNCDQEVINHNSGIFQEFTKVFDINDSNGYPIQYHSKDGKYKVHVLIDVCI